MLVVNKAQFGTAVWLNGKKIGEHLGCFTAGRFDVAGAIHWQGENRLVIRIGAHPGALPEWAMPPTDIEKGLWTPGIYDRVSLLLADSPVIETIQVAPHIRDSTILVETRLRNPGPARVAEIVHRVRLGKTAGPWGSLSRSGSSWRPARRKPSPNRSPYLTQPSGARRTRSFTSWKPAPAATRAQLASACASSISTPHRGGPGSTARSFIFAARASRCTAFSVIRNAPAFPGTSPGCGNCLAKSRIACTGMPFACASARRPSSGSTSPTRPDCSCSTRPLSGSGIRARYLKHWNEAEVIGQFKEFVRDNWNHPSVVLWDASNETFWPELRTKVIPAVRGLDHSNRPWECGYNGPQGPDDPYEDHPYFLLGRKKPPLFPLVAMETGGGWQKPIGTPMNSHACIINEYDALFVRRNGQPTLASRKEFDYLLGPKATCEQRFELSAYALAGLTEYWRAYRNYAGVMYLAYLDGDVTPNRDLRQLPRHRAARARSLFCGLRGQRLQAAGSVRQFLAAGVTRWRQAELSRDAGQRHPRTGPRPTRPGLGVGIGQSRAGRAQRAFDIPALGQATYDIELTTPAEAGPYQLKAQAFWDGKSWSPTVARRKVAVK